MGSEEDMGNLSKHRIGQVLYHQVHPMSLGPAKRKQCTRLGLAGLERDSRPSEGATEADVLPVMSAFIHKKGFPFRNRMNLYAMRFQVVGKRLLDIEYFPMSFGGLFFKAVKDLVDVSGVGHGAIEIRRQVLDRFGFRNPAD